MWHTSKVGATVNRRAFTLIELIIVMAMVAVVASLAIPRFDISTLRADANIRIVRIALQQAQRLSLQQQHDVIVSFDLTGGRVRVAEDTDNSKTVGGNDRVSWRGLTDGGRFTTPAAGVFGAVSKAVVGDNLKTLDAMPTITFHRSGSASSSLEVYVRVTGRKADAQRAIALIQSTGRSDSYRLVGSAWKKGGM